MENTGEIPKNRGLMMLKGVTKRIVEIRSPKNPHFERAVLYLRADCPYTDKRGAVGLAEDYLETLEPEVSEKPQKDLRVTVAVLSLSLGVALAALAALLVLYTKI